MKQWVRWAARMLPLCAISVLCLQSSFAQGTLLHDNGPIVTDPGGGFGGADLSEVQDSVFQYGFNHDLDEKRIADDFTVSNPGGWAIDSLVFYAWQTNSGRTPTITTLYYRIWDGSPDDPGSSVVFGDLATNRLTATTWSGIYRALDSSPSDTTRPLMFVTASGGATLLPGIYWIEWAAEGMLVSGPWCPPITILGQYSTGNALTYTVPSGPWAPVVDNSYPQGFPFFIYGTMLANPNPEINFTPSSMDFTLIVDQSDSMVMTISNTGLSTLTYTLSDDASAARMERKSPPKSQPIYEPIELRKGAPDPRKGEPQVDGMGGPDAFGHFWIDSDEPGGPTFSWTDITGTGTPVVLGDDAFLSVTLPFTFNYYGTDRTTVKVCSNGYLTFTSGGIDFGNDPIPSTLGDDDLIAGFWDDLDPSVAGGGTIHYLGSPTEFIVQYTNLERYLEPTSLMTFQMILYPSGDVVVQYLSMVGTLNSSTVGIENLDGTDGLQVIFNGTYVHDNLATRFYIPTVGGDWLNEIPSSGSILPGESADIQIVADATGLMAGTYNANVMISSNDPAHPDTTMPVSLTVLADMPAIAVSPDSINQELIVGDSVDVAITISNTGQADLTWSADIISSALRSLSSSNGNAVVKQAARIRNSEAARAGNYSKLCAPKPRAGKLSSSHVHVENGTIVQDGGFEDGTPSVFWNEFSSNFGTPLCDAGCGTGGGTGPHTGSWWSWFGGIATAVEEGYVDQDVTIPAGTATLRFWLEIPVADATGFMDVQMDGNTIMSFTEADAGTYGIYAEVSVDVSAYADGGIHNLKFHSITQPGAGPVNFMLDDVSIEAGPPVGSDWISLIGLTSGTITPGNSAMLTVRLRAGVMPASYSGTIEVTSNDPVNPSVLVPVSLTVSNIGPEAQMSLTHTPGDFNMGIFNDGSIGAENETFTGPGITWQGSNGCFVSGPIFGTTGVGSVNGLIGSFSIFGDLVNTSSNFAGGFISDANFDEIAWANLNDSAAPVPYGVDILQRSYTNTGEEYGFIRYGYVNSSGGDLVDFYAGIFMDWDIEQFGTNSGGVDVGRNLIYNFDNFGPTNYYGFAALDGNLTGRTTTASPPGMVREGSFDWISMLDVTIAANGDFRTWMGTGPNNIAAGDTLWLTFAVVAADSLLSLQVSTDNALQKAIDVGWYSVDDVNAPTAELPREFALTQNYPNPFNPATQIRYSLPEEATVSLKVYNLLGQLVTTLVSGELGAGHHIATWNGRNSAGSVVGSGMYFYRFDAEGSSGKSYSNLKKMLFLK